MCSIAGILQAPAPETGQVANSVRTALSEMIALQKHRAPDGEGFFYDGEISLGHGRLAILDLSPAGSQPMTSRDGRWTIVFNGEILNHLELKKQLDARFRSGTDTEVLLEACAVWGVENTLQRAAGMFAFALWDARERELILVRDRLGEKPLAYFWDGREFAFASELKALVGFHEGRLDPRAVDAYLALGYIPAPLAAFQGCRKLPAGHLLRLRWGGNGRVGHGRGGSAPQVEKWWHPENARREEVGETLLERVGELRHRMQIAVGERLRADVPVALALSGGVDSAVIAAECVKQDIRPQTFTVRFDNEFDGDRNTDESEVPFARALAAKLGLKHEVLELHADRPQVGRSGPYVSPAPRLPARIVVSMSARLDQMVSHYDEPFADSSALGCLALAGALHQREKGRPGYKVILNGDGGDEVFGGYRHYEHIGVKQWVKRAAAGAGLLDGRGAEAVYVESKVLFRRAERAQFLEESPAAGLLAEADFGCLNPAGHFPSASALQRAMWSDRSLPLANGLNYKTDIALGAFGIEGRAPFLDHRVVEWAQFLPDEDLVEGTEKKVLLRKAYERELPPEVLHRPKRGFGAPIEAWLQGPLSAAVAEALPCPLLTERMQRNQRGQRLWALLVFARWARRWNAKW